MTIEPMRVSDLAAVHALLGKSKLPVMGLDACVGAALVARDEAAVIASAALEVYPPYALLRSVAVDPARRGEGVGQMITSEAIALARRLGLVEVYLLTETAPAFFPKLGFAPIARAAVPPEVQQSLEFTTACCASAQAMRLALTATAPAGNRQDTT
jgi:amino-acid N-acetyltransferase